MFRPPHPGPLKKTVAPFGSKPVPVIVNVNACAAMGGAGDVVIVVSTGLELDVRTVKGFDGTPVRPFCTVTMNASPARVADPLNCVALLTVRALSGTTHAGEVHPGPLNVTTALLASNPLPVIVNVKTCPLIGGFGNVVRPDSCGAGGGESEIVSETLFETEPVDAFWTLME